MFKSFWSRAFSDLGGTTLLCCFFCPPPPQSLCFFLRAAECQDGTTAEFTAHAIRSEEHLLFLSLSNSRLSFYFTSKNSPFPYPELEEKLFRRCIF